MPDMPEDPGVFLAFDYGLKRLGVAVGQSLSASARPLATLASRDGKPDWPAIEALVREWAPQALIVGMPVNLDGSEHALGARVNRFCRQLEGRFAIPVHTVDERLSSLEAEGRLRDARQNGRRGHIRKEEIDSLAAAVLLENWFCGESHEH